MSYHVYNVSVLHWTHKIPYHCIQGKLNQHGQAVETTAGRRGELPTSNGDNFKFQFGIQK